MGVPPWPPGLRLHPTARMGQHPPWTGPRPGWGPVLSEALSSLRLLLAPGTSSCVYTSSDVQASLKLKGVQGEQEGR